MIHILKLQKEFAEAVLSGEKCFEVRLNDRGYQKGDYVKFNVVDNSLEIPHELNECVFEITYVLNGWGIKENHVVFGIKEVKDEESEEYEND